MIPVVWDWQKRSKNRASLLAEFFLSCPIRAANAPVPIPFLSVFIWVIRGYLKLSLCLCGLVRGGLRFQVSAGFNLGGHGETEKRAV